MSIVELGWAELSKSSNARSVMKAGASAAPSLRFQLVAAGS